MNLDPSSFSDRDRNFLLELGGPEAIMEIPAESIVAGDFIITEDGDCRIRKVICQEKPGMFLFPAEVVLIQTKFEFFHEQYVGFESKEGIIYAKGSMVPVIRLEGGEIDV